MSDERSTDPSQHQLENHTVRTVPLRHSIGFRLLRYVFGFYCVITILLTLGHLASEYQREKRALFSEFQLHQRSLFDTLSNSVWHLDIAQLRHTLDGVIEFPSIIGASVHSPQGELLSNVGVVAREEAALPQFQLHSTSADTIPGVEYEDELFRHQFELIQRDYGADEKIGSVILYARPETLYSRLYDLFSGIILIAIIKTLVLW